MVEHRVPAFSLEEKLKFWHGVCTWQIIGRYNVVLEIMIKNCKPIQKHHDKQTMLYKTGYLRIIVISISDIVLFSSNVSFHNQSLLLFGWYKGCCSRWCFQLFLLLLWWFSTTSLPANHTWWSDIVTTTTEGNQWRSRWCCRQFITWIDEAFFWPWTSAINSVIMVIMSLKEATIIKTTKIPIETQ